MHRVLFYANMFAQLVRVRRAVRALPPLSKRSRQTPCVCRGDSVAFHATASLWTHGASRSPTPTQLVRTRRAGACCRRVAARQRLIVRLTVLCRFYVTEAFLYASIYTANTRLQFFQQFFLHFIK